jgi:hypothetical protein
MFLADSSLEKPPALRMEHQDLQNMTQLDQKNPDNGPTPKQDYFTQNAGSPLVPVPYVLLYSL